MSEIDRAVVQKRILELERQKANFWLEAERQKAAYQGAIEALREILAPPTPPQPSPNSPAALATNLEREEEMKREEEKL